MSCTLFVLTILKSQVFMMGVENKLLANKIGPPEVKSSSNSIELCHMVSNSSFHYQLLPIRHVLHLACFDHWEIARLHDRSREQIPC